MTPTHIAVIALLADVVEGDYCTVSVVEADTSHGKLDDDGNEIPEYVTSDRVTLPDVDTSVRTDSERGAELPAEADRILAANGYARIGDWESSDNAAYAPAIIA